jgi:hypothetical protein
MTEILYFSSYSKSIKSIFLNQRSIIIILSSQLPPPLLKAAIDALEEAIDQSRKGTNKGNKFCVLFCDQAAELILKEKLRSVGVSI